VSATAGQAAEGVRSLADRFGAEPGMVVMEMGYDDDVDEDLRDALIDRCGELVDEDTDEVVDIVLLWWRDGDGDLVDTLVDAIAPLADNGAVWLLTPKAGRPGHVEPSEITESAPTAGLQQTTIVSVCRGVMPSALNTPMSWARSRTCSATVFSTPRPATAMISRVSMATRVVIATSARSPPRSPTRYPSPSAAVRAVV